MFDIKAYTNFRAATSADEEDRLMLEALAEARDTTLARFVNFSVFDYRTENPDSVHFLTYPIEWLSYYARHFYTAIDPLLNIDYRCVSNFDWRELFNDCEQAGMLDRFAEFGLGNEAFSIVTPVSGAAYAVTSLVYQCEPRQWPRLKRTHMDEFRRAAIRITERYRRCYIEHRVCAVPLSQRELQVLELAAMGNTDSRIASMMRIGKWTVVSHIQSAKEKLGCKNRTAAVAKAIAKGLIDLKHLA